MSRRYLLWDHDGVLVDTERWYFESTRSILASIGVDLPQRLYLEYMARGRSCWDLAKEAGMDQSRIRECQDARDSLYREYLVTQSIEIEGVEAVIEELSGTFRMAIVTTAKRRDLELIHQSRHLLRHFDFVLCVEDYARPKPYPDPYVAGLERFGAIPAETLVLEDSARGLASARAAGIPCVVIQNSFTAMQDFSSALTLLSSIRDLPAFLLRDESDSRFSH